MTYDTFINKVQALLLYDSIEDDEEHTAFIDQHVRSWMSTMQYFVDNFRIRNEDRYFENDMSIKCNGGIFTLPLALRSLTSMDLIRPIKPDCDPITYESDGETVTVEYSNDYNNGIVISGSGEAAANGIFTPSDNVNGEYSWALTGYTVTSDGDGTWSLTRTSDSAVISTLESTEKVPTGDWTDLTVTAVEFCESDCDEVKQLTQVKWTERDAVLSGDKCFSYTINPSATTAYVHPFPENNDDRNDDYIRINWDGMKSDYDGEDEVPFELDTVDNCSHYVNAQLSRKKEDKLSNYNSYYNSYLEGRKEIALGQRNKSKRIP